MLVPLVSKQISYTEWLYKFIQNVEMLAIILLIIYSNCLPPIEGKFFKTNVTDFSKCKVYYSRSGSIYRDFFEISHQHYDNGSLFDFHFAVMAASDAHILIAPSEQFNKGDPVYEIVIGAGGNTFCDIRRMQKSAVMATARIKGLLNSLDLQSFWIHISKDGIIEVGKEGEDLAFISWTDPDPLPLKVFSFSTWPGVEAKWYFDCPRDTTNSTKIERILTPIEQLRKNYLLAYDPFVWPVYNLSKITIVSISLATTKVSLDEHKAVFNFAGIISLTWSDEKLQWDPADYNGLNQLHTTPNEIWTPHLFLFNTANIQDTILDYTMLTVNSSGSVWWKTSLNLQSWCDPNDLGRWPHDEHTCELLLGFYRDFKYLQLIFNNDESIFDTPYSSQWSIQEVENYWNKGWNNRSDKINFDVPALSLKFKIKRISSAYTILLFTPFLVTTISLLLTFWISPFNSLKISLACLQLILSSIILIGIGLLVPVRSKIVPNLVLLYSFSLVAGLICIIIETIVINICRLERIGKLPKCLITLLFSTIVKFLLCLPELELSDRYGNLNESRLKLTDNQQTLWILLGVALDRISFFIYFGLSVYAFCLTY